MSPITNAICFAPAEGDIKAHEIARVTGFSYSAVGRQLRMLREQGALGESGILAMAVLGSEMQDLAEKEEWAPK